MNSKSPMGQGFARYRSAGIASIERRLFLRVSSSDQLFSNANIFNGCCKAARQSR